MCGVDICGRTNRIRRMGDDWWNRDHPCIFIDTPANWHHRCWEDNWPFLLTDTKTIVKADHTMYATLTRVYLSKHIKSVLSRTMIMRIHLQCKVFSNFQCTRYVVDIDTATWHWRHTNSKAYKSSGADVGYSPIPVFREDDRNIRVHIVLP